MFYVAYTVPARAGPSRPVLYFYNGGPGSASVWLHLGSFAPRRLVTNDPSTSPPQPFLLVDNADSLIDVADLVFVDAVGTGYSEAIAPADEREFLERRRRRGADARLHRALCRRQPAPGITDLSVRRVLRHDPLGGPRRAHGGGGDAPRWRHPAIVDPRLQHQLRRVRAGPGQLRRKLSELRNDRRVVFADLAGAGRAPTPMPPSCAASAAASYGPGRRTPGCSRERRRRRRCSPSSSTSPARRSSSGRPTSISTRPAFAATSSPASCSAATTRASRLPTARRSPTAAILHRRRSRRPSPAAAEPLRQRAALLGERQLHLALRRDRHLGFQPRRARPARHDSRSHRSDDAAAGAAHLVARRLSRPGHAVPPDRARPGPPRPAAAPGDCASTPAAT